MATKTPGVTPVSDTAIALPVLHRCPQSDSSHVFILPRGCGLANKGGKPALRNKQTISESPLSPNDRPFRRNSVPCLHSFIGVISFVLKKHNHGEKSLDT